MSDYYFIAFESTNHALSAEDYLKNNNSKDIDMIKGFIDSGFIKVKGIYRRKDENGMGRIVKVR